MYVILQHECKRVCTTRLQLPRLFYSDRSGVLASYRIERRGVFALSVEPFPAPAADYLELLDIGDGQRTRSSLLSDMHGLSDMHAHMHTDA